jgi:hypothetical protein
VGSVVGGTAGQAAADFVMNMMEGDGDGDPCEEETPRRVTNPKHHPNSKSPEPENVQELFARSLVDKKGVRWAKDSDGIIHRFSRPINGETHWNGSTGGHY